MVNVGYIFVYVLVEKEITLKLHSKQGSGQSLLTNKPRQSASKIEIRSTGGLEKTAKSISRKGPDLYQEKHLFASL